MRFLFLRITGIILKSIFIYRKEKANELFYCGYVVNIKNTDER